MTSLDELYDTYLRPLSLEWRLTEGSRRKIILASTLPALIVVAQVVEAIILYAFNEDRLFGEGLWHRLYYGSAAFRALSPVAVGALFFAGLLRWSRMEGTWMLVIGAALASVAVLLGFLGAVVSALITDRMLLSDLHVLDVWVGSAYTFGLLSVGFFFVAHRGLTQAPA